jgi:hypothetical protein
MTGLTGTVADNHAGQGETFRPWPMVQARASLKTQIAACGPRRDQFLMDGNVGSSSAPLADCAPALRCVNIRQRQVMRSRKSSRFRL